MAEQSDEERSPLLEEKVRIACFCAREVYFYSVERSSTIVDMGAGEAILHLRLHDAGFKALHSFDLVAANERVTVANMNKARLSNVASTATKRVIRRYRCLRTASTSSFSASR